MKTELVLAALLALTLAPTASAAPPEPDCIQVYRELTAEPVAVTLVNGCTVQVEVTTGTGDCLERYFEQDLGTVYVQSRDTCHYLVRIAATDPEAGLTASASAPCYDIYNEWTVGPVTVIQRNSCTYEVYLDDEQVYPASVGASGPTCYPVYREHEVGPVRVVQRNSCSAEVYLFGEPVLR